MSNHALGMSYTCNVCRARTYERAADIPMTARRAPQGRGIRGVKLNRSRTGSRGRASAEDLRTLISGVNEAFRGGIAKINRGPRTRRALTCPRNLRRLIDTRDRSLNEDKGGKIIIAASRRRRRDARDEKYARRLRFHYGRRCVNVARRF